MRIQEHRSLDNFSAASVPRGLPGRRMSISGRLPDPMRCVVARNALRRQYGRLLQFARYQVSDRRGHRRSPGRLRIDGEGGTDRKSLLLNLFA